MLAGFGLVMMEDFSVNSWLLLLKILGIVFLFSLPRLPVRML